MFTKNVDAVLKTFNKAITDLEQIETDRGKKIGDLETKLTEARSEKTRAGKVLLKLKDLIE